MVEKKTVAQIRIIDEISTGPGVGEKYSLDNLGDLEAALNEALLEMENVFVIDVKIFKTSDENWAAAILYKETQ